MGMPPVPADSGELGLSWQPERRRRVRRNVVDSQLVTVDLGFQKGALLLDVSEEGMGVQALSRAPLGTTTSLNFDLPDTLVRVEGTGMVAWTDNSGRIGIRFGELSNAAKTHLERWLSRQNNGAVAATGIDQLPAWPPLEQKDEVEVMLREIREQGLQPDTALDYIVQRITVLTRATGAAVALGNDQRMICAATCGNAPDVGVELNPHSGLSGECLRSGEIVRCEDTETDPRADRLVCRRLEIRSAVILPVRLQEWLGVVEVFSDLPHAFQSTDVLLLRRVTDLVGSLLTKGEKTGTAELASPAIPSPAGLPAQRKPVLLGIAEVPVADILKPSPPPPPPPEQLHLSEHLATGADLDESSPAAAIAPGSALNPVVEMEEQRTTAPDAKSEQLNAAPEAVSPPVPPPVSHEATRQPKEPMPAVRHSFSDWPQESQITALPGPATAPRVRKDEWTTLRRSATKPQAQVRARRPGQRRDVSRTVVATILVAALAAVAWQLYVVLTVTGDSSPAASVRNVQPDASEAAATSSRPAAISAAADSAPARKEPAAAKGSRDSRRNSEDQEPDVAVRHFAAPSSPKESESAAPPSLEAPGNTAALTDVLKPSSTAPVLASSLSGGRLLQRYEPAYPELARRMRVEGPVLLRATIGRNGRVQSVEIMSGSPMLASAAVAAVKRWRYEPFRLNGKTVEGETVVNINFVLPR